MTTRRSVIEQRIIDGSYYWDQIGMNWYRLLFLPIPNNPGNPVVVGTVKHQGGFSTLWDVYLNSHSLDHPVANSTSLDAAKDCLERAITE